MLVVHALVKEGIKDIDLFLCSSMLQEIHIDGS